MGVFIVLQVQYELFDELIVCVFLDRIRYFVPYFYTDIFYRTLKSVCFVLWNVIL